MRNSLLFSSLEMGYFSPSPPLFSLAMSAHDRYIMRFVS